MSIDKTMRKTTLKSVFCSMKPDPILIAYGVIIVLGALLVAFLLAKGLVWAAKVVIALFSNL